MLFISLSFVLIYFLTYSCIERVILLFLFMPLSCYHMYLESIIFWLEKSSTVGIEINLYMNSSNNMGCPEKQKRLIFLDGVS